MNSRKLINSFIRRFSDYIALNSNLYLSHKPDIHTKLNKLEIIKVPLFSPIDSAIFGLYKDFNLHEVVDSLTV